MKTHMNNTVSTNLKNDICGHTIYQKHHQRIFSGKVKPKVVTSRKQQYQVHKNKKVQINTNPNQHVNILFKKLHNNEQNINIKSTLDNKKPLTYDFSKTILKDKIKKNKQQTYQQKQHQRQLQSLQNKIQNCKSLAQRKKDNYDPIVNPVYLMKSKKDQIIKASIQPYCRTVLEKNRPKSAIQPNNKKNKGKSTVFMNSQTQKYDTTTNDAPRSMYYGGCPPEYTTQKVKNESKQQKNRPISANHSKPYNNSSSDLPEANYNALMRYILENKIYKDTDLKVFYVRLCYLYGEEQIDQLWEQVMDQLER